MSKNLLVRQTSYFVLKRSFALSSINLDSEQNVAARPFSDIPSISAAKLIIRYLPGGKYYNCSMSELHKKMNAEFGTIFRFPALFGKPPMVVTYNAKDFEKVIEK